MVLILQLSAEGIWEHVTMKEACILLLTYRGRMALGSSNTIGMALWGAQDKSILMKTEKRLSVYSAGLRRSESQHYLLLTNKCI